MLLKILNLYFIDSNFFFFIHSQINTASYVVYTSVYIFFSSLLLEQIFCQIASLVFLDIKAQKFL